MLLLLLVPLGLSALLSSYHGPLFAFLIVIVTYHAVLLSSIALYRISPWHPLARYPGPLLLKTSQVWMARRALQGGVWHYIRQLHQQYGDVVRIGAYFNATHIMK